jgi:hypothetical protein
MALLDDTQDEKYATERYRADRTAQAHVDAARITAEAAQQAREAETQSKEMQARTTQGTALAALRGKALGSSMSYGGGVRAETPTSEGGPSLAELSPGAEVQQLGGGVEVTGDSGTYGRTGNERISNPVQIIRGGKGGLRSTYAGPAPGEEYLSLVQANQAFNKAEGVGTFVPEGAELETLKAEGKGPFKQLKLAEQELTEKKNLETFMKSIQSHATEQGWGTFDPKANTFTAKLPEYAGVMAGLESLARTDPTAAITQAKEKLGVLSLKSKYDNDKVLGNIYGLYKDARGQELDTEQMARIINGVKAGDKTSLLLVDQLHKEKAAKEQQAYIKKMALFNQAQRDALTMQPDYTLVGP